MLIKNLFNFRFLKCTGYATMYATPFNLFRKNLYLLIIFGVVYMTTFILVLPSCLEQLPYSTYFSLDKNSPVLREKVDKYNKESLDESIKQLILTPDKSTAPQNGNDFAVGVITMRRKGSAKVAGYLTQTAAHLLREVYRYTTSMSGMYNGGCLHVLT